MAKAAPHSREKPSSTLVFDPVEIFSIFVNGFRNHVLVSHFFDLGNVRSPLFQKAHVLLMLPYPPLQFISVQPRLLCYSLLQRSQLLPLRIIQILLASCTVATTSSRRGSSSYCLAICGNIVYILK